MNAKEARKKTKEINLDEINSQYARVKDEISEGVYKGKYECFVYEFLIKDVKDQLISEGFIIKSNQGGMNETVTRIIWE